MAVSNFIIPSKNARDADIKQKSESRVKLNQRLGQKPIKEGLNVINI
jgi:hypothetical protein